MVRGGEENRGRFKIFYLPTQVPETYTNPSFGAECPSFLRVWMRPSETATRVSSRGAADSLGNVVSTTISIGTEVMRWAILSKSLKSPMNGTISFAVRVFAAENSLKLAHLPFD